MKRREKHIVSALTWATTFDEKSRANEFQNRLSSWSNNVMPAIMEDVFDTLCPSDERWQIQAIEIDLGNIDFAYLESELATALRKQLSEQIKELTFQSGGSVKNFVVQNDAITSLTAIRTFLLSGVMPWNYNNESGSVNEMFADQLRNNHRQLTDLIYDVAADDEIVRRRIAWQITEPNISLLIHHLEPGNSAEVMAVTSELQNIQERESVVQSGSSDFRKHISLWVLNYLLTDRGSMFNRVAFMKSTLKQMADRYHVSYTDLLDFIAIAVEKVSAAVKVTHTFVITLAVLIEEQKQERKQKKLPETFLMDDERNEDNPLLHFLAFGTWHRALPEKKSLNEIITEELTNNEVVFVSALKRLAGMYPHVGKRLVSHMSEDVIGLLVTVLAPSKQSAIRSFINELMTLQQDTAIFRTSASAFNNYLQEWLLDYLLTFRGGTLDMEAFAISGTRRMVQKFGIARTDVAVTLDNSLKKDVLSLSLYGSLIKGIQAIAQDNGHNDNKQRTGNATEDWELLASYMKNTDPQSMPIDKTVLSDLIVRLAGQDRFKFRELIISANLLTHLWAHLIDNGQTASLEVVIAALNPDNRGLVTESIQLLRVLLVEARFNIGPKILWQIAIKFLSEHGESAFNNAVFIDYCTSELARNSSVSRFDLLSAIIGHEIPSISKSAATLQVFGNLTSLYLAEMPANIFSENGLVGKITIQLSDAIDHNDYSSYARLEKQFVHLILSNPMEAWKFFASYPDKEKLNKLLFLSLDIPACKLLVERNSNGFSAYPAAISEVYKEMAGSPEVNELIYFLDEHLWRVLFLKVIFSRHASGIDTLKSAIAGLVKQRPAMRNMVAVFLINLEKKLGIAQGVLSATVINFPSKSFSIDTTTEMVSKKMEREALASHLLDHFNDTGFAQLRYGNSATAKSWLRYMLPSAEEMLTAFINQYKDLLTHQLNKTTKEVTQLLIETYWRCILDYATYRGNATAFKELCHSTILVHFSISEKEIKQRGISIRAERVEGRKYGLGKKQQIEVKKVIELIQACFANDYEEIEWNGELYSFDELFRLGVEVYPQAVRDVVSQLELNERLQEKIGNIISFDRFSTLIMEGLEVHQRDMAPGQHQTAPGNTSLPTIQNKAYTPWVNLFRLIREDWSVAAQKLHDTRSDNPALSKDVNTALQYIGSKGLLPDLITHLVTLQHIPYWGTGILHKYDIKEVINDIVSAFPDRLRIVLKYEIISTRQQVWLSDTIDFKTLTNAIAETNKRAATTVNHLYNFYKTFSHSMAGLIPARIMRLALFQLLVRAWTSDEWNMISGENILNELLWELQLQHGIAGEQFISFIEQNKQDLPPSFQVAFHQLKEDTVQQETLPQKQTATVKKTKPVISKKTIMDMGVKIPINNAGVVLLNSYIPMLFDRLGITKEGKFVSESRQEHAVHYVQYLVTGMAATEEQYLPLNKVLCGLPLFHPVPAGIIVTEAEADVMKGLLNAVIAHWPQSGSATIEGLRGNWLFRPGILSEQTDKWELNVEKRPYDLLINKSPFSLSYIKFPWMGKQLMVNWAY